MPLWLSHKPDDFATISSGLYRFRVIAVLLDVKDIPQVGPLQWGRIIWTGHPSIDKHGQSQFIEIIVSLPVDYLDVSAGFYNVDKRLIYPTLPDVLSSRRTGTLDLARRYPHIQFIMSGKSSGAWDPSLPANVHVGICRDLIANPNFLRDRDQGCNDCMKCHYFSRGQSYLTCGRWTYPRVLPFPVKQA